MFYYIEKYFDVNPGHELTIPDKVRKLLTILDTVYSVSIVEYRMHPQHKLASH